ncbi:hypothetical protein V9T40_004795 [Parthenolecanium corni]|uniref:Uncharacterized protein n=1 Tax=Parthenolecanium corni TaxID=536013 RepID=A0AAN9Y2D1_9HEMI
MVVLENPSPDVASAAVGLLDPSGPQIPISVDANAVTGSAVAVVDETSACRVSASMKMVPKRYTNLHNWLSLGPVSAKQLKEAVRGNIENRCSSSSLSAVDYTDLVDPTRRPLAGLSTLSLRFTIEVVNFSLSLIYQTRLRPCT